VADILVTATTDSGAWDAGIARLADALHARTGDGSMAAAEYIGTLAKAKLHEREHGPLTWSPSPPGSPPATVSGDLAKSIIHIRSGETAAMVGPTTKYGRIQELGGTMHGDPVMVFRKLAGWEPGSQAHAEFLSRYTNSAVVTFHMRIVKLAGRAYLHPATEEAVNSGRVRDIYARWWAEAIESGAG
jgi:phage gpG-like protein